MPASKTDKAFEALCEAVGLDWESLTESERGRVNAALRELKVWFCDELVRRGKRWGQLYANAILTPQALVTHWQRLGEVASTRLEAEAARRDYARTDAERQESTDAALIRAAFSPPAPQQLTTSQQAAGAAGIAEARKLLSGRSVVGEVDGD